MPVVSMIVSVSDNGIIGRDGVKPWRNPLEEQRFEQLTRNKPLLVGRKTFRALPGIATQRWYFVPSSNPFFLEQGSHRDFEGYGYFFCPDFTSALSSAAALADIHRNPEVFVIGGASLFAQAAPHVGRIYLTQVHLTTDGDLSLPELNLGDWREIMREEIDLENPDIPRQTYSILQRPSENTASIL